MHTTIPADAAGALTDPLDGGSIEALVSGRHGAPFDVLGPHMRTIQDQRAWIVRAFLPGARAAWVVPLADGADGARNNGALGDDGKPRGMNATASPVEQPDRAASGVAPAFKPGTDNQHDARPAGVAPAFKPGPDNQHDARPAEARLPLPMRPIHPAGLFSLVAPADLAGSYRLRIQRQGGATDEIADPYAFPPLLTDYDLYLIGEGKHQQLYDKLGAHPHQVEGVSGTAFAVWAPNARRVSVVGDFNGWDEHAHPMRLRSSGVWELFLPGVEPGALYKYAILSWNQGYRVLKADPFAFAAELRPGTASRVWNLHGYVWGDADWMRDRARRQAPDAPMAVYEVHAGSWRPSSEDGRHVTYRDLAHQLVPYVKDLGYTHIELMPILEHPFDGSWGYQVTGYFAPTSRYGTPQDFMYFVDYCHQHGIGVLLDWVPAHFPRDEHGLRYFDGSHLYEHADPRQGEHPDWGTVVFNYGRNEVRAFLISNALFWLGMYHLDGLRVDAVASMIYLDYSRKQGEWLPNRYGGRENIEAISFLRECNSVIHARHADTLTIAEESTAWPKVTWPPDDGGLGFSLKWNMGWMHDVLEYAKRDPIYRQFHQNELTFSMIYAYSEKFVLPFSHDEVVHMKGSMLTKMAGDRWQKLANLRALYAYMYAHPGKKLLFMGGEFGQWKEWDFAGYLDWGLLNPAYPFTEEHIKLRDLVRDLNHLLVSEPALHERDFHPGGFEWIDGSDTAHSVLAWIRYGNDRRDPLVFVVNFTPVPQPGYRVGVNWPGRYAEVLNTDAALYGGSNVGNLGGVESEPVSWHGRAQSIRLTLPPLAALLLRPIPTPPATIDPVAATTVAATPPKKRAPRAMKPVEAPPADAAPTAAPPVAPPRKRTVRAAQRDAAPAIAPSTMPKKRAPRAANATPAADTAAAPAAPTPKQRIPRARKAAGDNESA